jgi:hypothetical protein
VRKLLLFLLLSATFFAPQVALGAPPGVATLEIGDGAPDFRLPGVDGKEHALADFAKSRLLLVVFTCNHCPTAQACTNRGSCSCTLTTRTAGWLWWRSLPTTIRDCGWMSSAP